MCLPTTKRNREVRDLEARGEVPQPQDVGGSVAHKTSNPAGQSQTKSDPSQTLPVSSNQAIIGNGNPGQRGPTGDGPDPEPRMSGDFDDSANALWTLYGKEAKSYDESRIQTLKDDMDGVLLFTGLFAVVLTAFIIDSKQNLKVNPQDQMVYYLQQNVAMLDQISHQIFSIAPQFSIPPTPPAPFPDFKPSASNIRVNVFWFMALIFSLTAALLATLVQQWVRDYMHVFQRYSHPLKSARLRQYLHEGSKKWYMHPVAEALPALVHVSLFLFFVGLCDFVFDINTTIGLSTTIPIAITGLLYIFTTIAPIISPQSPYQNSFSALIWYAIQKFGGRRFKNPGPDGSLKPVSFNMAQRRMRLAMEETKDREGRDKRAIRWLVSDMTEDAEMESLAMAIPGSFSDGWGMSVWKEALSSEDRNESTTRNEHSRIQHVVRSVIGPRTAGASVSTPHARGRDTIQVLSARVKHLLDTCKNRTLFATDELWRRRTRACIETTAWLVCGVGADLGQIGDMLMLLGQIGKDQTVRESSLVGKEQSFVMHWTCLSLVAIRPVLGSTRLLHAMARQASGRLEVIGEGGTPTQIIETYAKALKYQSVLSAALTREEDQTDERVKEILHEHESQISELAEIDIKFGAFWYYDLSISRVEQAIDRITHGIITRHLSGIKSDVSDMKGVDFGQFVELFRDPHTLLFISPLRNIRRIQSFAKTLQNILQGPDVDTLQKFQKTIKGLREIEFPLQLDNLFRRQKWRLLDLQDGGLGLIVELFFLALKQLLSNSSSKESHSELYRGTFRAITSDWSKYKGSVGTQTLLVNMVAPDDGIIFHYDYPGYIVDDFLVFIGNILDEQTGSHIDDVVKQLTDVPTYGPRHALSVKVLGVICPSQASSS